MSEYVHCWQVQDAYDLTNIRCVRLVSSLASISGAVQEYFSWSLVSTPPIPFVSPGVDILLKATILYRSLKELTDKDPHQVRGILRDIVMAIYEGERPEMNDLPDIFPGDDTFLELRFRPLYLNSLLLKRADVRAYCRKNEIRQVREVKGFMMENTPPSAWITGSEIMTQHRIAANDLGQACYTGKLQAWSHGGVLHIFDLSTVRRIPQYPPPGVDPFCHAKQGDVVEWEWDIDCMVNEKAIQKAEYVFKNTGGGSNRAIREAARRYMKTAYHIAPDGEPGTDTGLPAKTFLFDFKQFYFSHCERDGSTLLHARVEDIQPLYEKELSEMCFKRNEFEAWRNPDSAELGKPSSLQPHLPTIPNASLPLPKIKTRVSSEGTGNEQVWNTCQENLEAVAYVKTRREQGATPKEIAGELIIAGGGKGVIGCIMDPTRQNTDAAREHGKYLTKKAGGV